MTPPKKKASFKKPVALVRHEENLNHLFLQIVDTNQRGIGRSVEDFWLELHEYMHKWSKTAPEKRGIWTPPRIYSTAPETPDEIRTREAFREDDEPDIPF